MTNKKKNLLSLYVHWPYCESKCPYCDFNSHVIEDVDKDAWIKSYTNQLYEYKSLLDKFDVKFDNLSTIFFGGGTPSLMPLEILDYILNISSKILSSILRGINEGVPPPKNIVLKLSYLTSNLSKNDLY